MKPEGQVMKLPPPPYNGTPEEIAAWFDVLLNRSNELMIQALAREKAKKKAHE